MLGARPIPRLRHTISVRDDRLPSKQAARSALPNSAVASAAGLEGRPGPVTPSTLAKFAPAAFNQSMKLTDRTAPRIFPEFAEPNSAHIRGFIFSARRTAYANSASLRTAPSATR